jgi:hypothetical protein
LLPQSEVFQPDLGGSLVSALQTTSCAAKTETAC